MYRGLSVADLVRSTVLEKAQEIVDRQERILLNDQQRDYILRLLDNPPRPTDSLRRAFASHKKLIRESR